MQTQEGRLKREGSKVGKGGEGPFTSPCYVYPHVQGYFGLDRYVPLNRLWMSALYWLLKISLFSTFNMVSLERLSKCVVLTMFF